MADAIASSPLEPFGVELELDLRRELSDAEQAEFRRLYELHDLVLVRGPVLTMDEQMRVCELLGPVLMSDTGLMSKDTAIGLAGVELCFHSDYAYSPEPLQAISLHAVDVVDGETSTRFAGGRHAYESLAPDVQARVADASALQVFGVRLDARNRLAELDPVLPSTAHPLAPEHEASGSRYLFAPEMTTDSIVGLDPDESEALLAEVFAALYGPGQVLEHRWTHGGLRALEQHARRARTRRLVDGRAPRAPARHARDEGLPRPLSRARVLRMGPVRRHGRRHVARRPRLDAPS